MCRKLRIFTEIKDFKQANDVKLVLKVRMCEKLLKIMQKLTKTIGTTKFAESGNFADFLTFFSFFGLKVENAIVFSIKNTSIVFSKSNLQFNYVVFR